MNLFTAINLYSTKKIFIDDLIYAHLRNEILFFYDLYNSVDILKIKRIKL